MFTMTLRRPDGELITRGESLPGEDWQAALLRLYRTARGDDTERQILSFSRWEGDRPEGKGSVSLVRRAGPTGGAQWPIEHVNFETDPPQT